MAIKLGKDNTFMLELPFRVSPTCEVKLPLGKTALVYVSKRGNGESYWRTIIKDSQGRTERTYEVGKEFDTQLDVNEYIEKIASELHGGDGEVDEDEDDYRPVKRGR
jgi:hypothetical protein